MQVQISLSQERSAKFMLTSSYESIEVVKCIARFESLGERTKLRGCIQKFPDWPPGARTANGTALRH
jgi:hypothetical protein